MMNNSSDKDDMELFQPFDNHEDNPYEISKLILPVKNNDSKAKLELSVLTNFLSTMAWDRLGHICGESTSLEKLRLSCICFSLGGADAEGFLHGLQNNRSIRDLSLFGVNFQDASKMRLLSPFLSNSTNLKNVTFSCCRVGREGANILSNALSKREQDTLEHFSFNNNRLRDGDLEELVETLTECRQLNSLSLERNRIGRQGCTSLAKLLCHPQSNLRYLHLDDNSIDDDSLATLLDPLACNNKMWTIDLKNNGISRRGCKDLLKLICDTSTVTGVVKSNHILCSVGVIYELLTLNPTLGNDDANLFSSAIKENKRNKLRAIDQRDVESAIIKRKVIWSHARGDLNIGDQTIHTGAIPSILSWFGKSDLIHYHDPPYLMKRVTLNRLDSIYRIVKSKPEICQMGLKSCCKRKINLLRVQLGQKRAKRKADENNQLRD